MHHNQLQINRQVTQPSSQISSSMSQCSNQTQANPQYSLGDSPQQPSFLELSTSQHQFNTMNKIYQLQSIINKLTIQKQKVFIAYSNIVKENGELVQTYEKFVDELKGKVRDRERSIEGLNMLVGNWRDRATKVEAERDQLERLLDSVPMTQVQGRLSVNLLILEYEKNKVQLTTMTNELSKITQQNKQLQSKLQDYKTQNNSLKLNIQKLIRENRETLELASRQSKNEINQIRIQYEQEIQNMRKTNKRHHQNLKQLQQQKQKLQTKNMSNRHISTNYQKLSLQLQLSKQQQKKHSHQNSLFKQKYKQLADQYNNLINENNRLTAENMISGGQVTQTRVVNQRLLEENQRLREQARVSKEVEARLQAYMGRIDGQEVAKKGPNEELAKLQMIISESSKQKKSYQSQIFQCKKRNAYLQQKIQQMQKQIKVFHQRILTQQQLMQRCDKNNQNLVSQLSNLQSQNGQLKLQIQKYSQKINQMQIKIKRHQLGRSPTKQKNTISISAEKYQNLMEGLAVLGAEKTGLIKQRLALKLQIQEIEAELLKKIKQVNAQDFHIVQLKGQKDQINNQKIQCIQRIKKLQKKIQRIRKQAQQQKKNMQSKLDTMKETIQKIKKQRTKLQESMQKRKRRPRQLRYQLRLCNIQIKPTQDNLFKNRKQQKNMIESSQTLKQQHSINNQPDLAKKSKLFQIKDQIKQLKMNTFGKQIKHRNLLVTSRTNTNTNTNLNISVKQDAKIEQVYDKSPSCRKRVDLSLDRCFMKNRNLNTQKLDQMIKQLKKENYQLSKKNNF